MKKIHMEFHNLKVSGGHKSSRGSAWCGNEAAGRPNIEIKQKVHPFQKIGGSIVGWRRVYIGFSNPYLLEWFMHCKKILGENCDMFIEILYVQLIMNIIYRVGLNKSR